MAGGVPPVVSLQPLFTLHNCPTRELHVAKYIDGTLNIRFTRKPVLLTSTVRVVYRHSVVLVLLMVRVVYKTFCSISPINGACCI